MRRTAIPLAVVLFVATALCFIAIKPAQTVRASSVIYSTGAINNYGGPGKELIHADNLLALSGITPESIVYFLGIVRCRPGET